MLWNSSVRLVALCLTVCWPRAWLLTISVCFCVYVFFCVSPEFENSLPPLSERSAIYQPQNAAAPDWSPVAYNQNTRIFLINKLTNQNISGQKENLILSEVMKI